MNFLGRLDLMNKLAAVLLVLLMGCHTEHIYLTTQLWHSEICHPDTWYKKKPVGGNPACKWYQEYPPDAPYQVK